MNRLIFILALIGMCMFLPYQGFAKELPKDVVLTTLDGTIIDAKTLKASPLVLMFGSTWCPECRREAPEMQKACLEYRDKGVLFLLVMGMTDDEQMREFIQTYKLTFPVAKDNGFAEAHDVRVIPQTFFYAKGGVFSKRIMGPATYRELTTNIEKILVK